MEEQGLLAFSQAVFSELSYTVWSLCLGNGAARSRLACLYQRTIKGISPPATHRHTQSDLGNLSIEIFFLDGSRLCQVDSLS